MSANDVRAARPLDPGAAATANDQFYAAHPEMVQDGTRLPFCSDAQRSEWTQKYAAAGGKVEDKEMDPDAADQIVKSCPKANLIVTVLYNGLNRPIEGIHVAISGPEKREGDTDDTGKIKFMDIEPGTYNVKASWEKRNAVVDRARAQTNSGDWAIDKTRGKYGPGLNKCNVFVNEMQGSSAPSWSRFSWHKLSWEDNPPLAGDWATGDIPGYSTVQNPQPGDVVAEKINYSDATGHVGIVSYPKPLTDSVTVAPGETKEHEMRLEGQTLSVSSNTETVVENDWGFRSGQSPVFKRN